MSGWEIIIRGGNIVPDMAGRGITMPIVSGRIANSRIDIISRNRPCRFPGASKQRQCSDSNRAVFVRAAWVAAERQPSPRPERRCAPVRHRRDQRLRQSERRHRRLIAHKAGEIISDRQTLRSERNPCRARQLLLYNLVIRAAADNRNLRSASSNRSAKCSRNNNVSSNSNTKCSRSSNVSSNRNTKRRRNSNVSSNSSDKRSPNNSVSNSSDKRRRNSNVSNNSRSDKHHRNSNVSSSRSDKHRRNSDSLRRNNRSASSRHMMKKIITAAAVRDEIEDCATP